MFSLLFIKNHSIAKILVNSLNSSRTFSQKHVVCKSSWLSKILFEKQRINYMGTQLWTSRLITQNNQTHYWQQNTNVANNVLLYKYESVTLFKVAHIFGICSIILWSYVTWYLYNDMFFHNFWTESFTRYLETNFLTVALYTFSTILGPVFYPLIYFLCARTIRYIILHKGGTRVTFITLNPFKNKRTITAPVEKVHCVRARTDPIGAFTSLKINPYRMNFLIDKSGTYVNGILFDQTVGCRN